MWLACFESALWKVGNWCIKGEEWSFQRGPSVVTRSTSISEVGEIKIKRYAIGLVISLIYLFH